MRRLPGLLANDHMPACMHVAGAGGAEITCSTAAQCQAVSTKTLPSAPRMSDPEQKLPLMGCSRRRLKQHIM